MVVPLRHLSELYLVVSLQRLVVNRTIKQIALKMCATELSVFERRKLSFEAVISRHQHIWLLVMKLAIDRDRALNPPKEEKRSINGGN
jgi:hypothetical protein